MQKYILWFTLNLFPKKCIICKQGKQILCKKHTPPKAEKVSIDKSIKTFSYSHYHNPINKKILHTFKYKGVIQLNKIIGEQMSHLAKEFQKETIVIPVPIHWTKRIYRGFNQSELIAKEVVKHNPYLKLNVTIVKKTKKTKSQASLSGIQRHKNLKNSFKLTNPEKIKNKDIIIIDDVISTGATINEITTLLIKNNARKISVITFLKS